jgi:hypothetical protein
MFAIAHKRTAVSVICGRTTTAPPVGADTNWPSTSLISDVAACGDSPASGLGIICSAGACGVNAASVTTAVAPLRTWIILFQEQKAATAPWKGCTEPTSPLVVWHQQYCKELSYHAEVLLKLLLRDIPEGP